MSDSREQGLMRFMQDFRDDAFHRLSYLVGSTEQVSDNIEQVSAQERFERDDELFGDFDWRSEQVFLLHAEEQMAIRDLLSAHNMFRFTAGPLKHKYRVQASDLIQTIRRLRFEQASLQEWPA